MIHKPLPLRGRDSQNENGKPREQKRGLRLSRGRTAESEAAGSGSPKIPFFIPEVYLTPSSHHAHSKGVV
jgi:hypothetical protein